MTRLVAYFLEPHVVHVASAVDGDGLINVVSKQVDGRMNGNSLETPRTQMNRVRVGVGLSPNTKFAKFKSTKGRLHVRVPSFGRVHFNRL